MDIDGIRVFYREAGPPDAPPSWLLETHLEEVAALMREFLGRVHAERRI